MGVLGTPSLHLSSCKGLQIVEQCLPGRSGGALSPKFLGVSLESVAPSSKRCRAGAPWGGRAPLPCIYEACNSAAASSKTCRVGVPWGSWGPLPCIYQVCLTNLLNVCLDSVVASSKQRREGVPLGVRDPLPTFTKPVPQLPQALKNVGQSPLGVLGTPSLYF